MALLPILQFPDPRLHKVARPVAVVDARIQAFNFRMCMSKDARNRVPFPKPEGYDEAPVGGIEEAATASANYFNYRKLSIFGGSNEIQKNIISKMILGL